MIAVWVNEAGSTASIDEKGIVRQYRHNGRCWEAVREIPMYFEHTEGIVSMRRSLLEMVQKLEGSKVFVAKEIAGQLYYVLEANGFEAFEAEGKPELFLDSIQEAVNTITEDKSIESSKPLTLFEKTDREGYYYLNLKKALILDASLSSKKILLPFLRRKEFLGLEIICDHLPRWLETELIALELQSDIVKQSENEIKVTVLL